MGPTTFTQEVVPHVRLKSKWLHIVTSVRNMTELTRDLLPLESFLLYNIFHVSYTPANKNGTFRLCNMLNEKPMFTCNYFFKLTKRTILKLNTYRTKLKGRVGKFEKPDRVR